MVTEQAPESELLYDGACPLCRTYCRSIDRPDGMTLVDARRDGELLNEITRLGLDIEEGMVLKADGQIFYGSAAMLELSRRLPARGWTGWLNRFFFSTPSTARRAYAAAKAVRNVTLRLLGIKRIGNLQRRF